jgi:hypothetical protein
MIRFVGMVHVAALPGSPAYGGSLDDCVKQAVRDARTLEAGGVDAVMVENYFDVPFRPQRVEPHTIAALTRVCLAVREAVSCPIGVNVLRNDSFAALGIALAAGGSFIRVNVHTGVMVTDQGLITGRADELLRLRRALDAEHVQIWADVLVKHAGPLTEISIEDAVDDLVHRGLAEAVIVSGTGTGRATPVETVRRAAGSTSGRPLYVGSGVTAENVSEHLPPAAGVIVGSWLKQGGDVSKPVDQERVSVLRDALDQAVGTST